MQGTQPQRKRKAEYSGSEREDISNVGNGQEMFLRERERKRVLEKLLREEEQKHRELEKIRAEEKAKSDAEIEALKLELKAALTRCADETKLNGKLLKRLEVEVVGKTAAEDRLKVEQAERKREVHAMRKMLEETNIRLEMVLMEYKRLAEAVRKEQQRKEREERREEAEKENQRRKTEEQRRRKAAAEELRAQESHLAEPWTADHALKRYTKVLDEFSKTKFSSTRPLTFAAMPWPVLERDVQQIDAANVKRFFESPSVKNMGAENLRHLVRLSLVALHDDKLAAKLATVSDDRLRASLRYAANTVTQELTQILDTLNNKM